MAFVFLILVFFIDQQGLSDKHCLLSLFSLLNAVLLIFLTDWPCDYLLNIQVFKEKIKKQDWHVEGLFQDADK